MSRWAMLIAAISAAALIFVARERKTRDISVKGVGVVNVSALVEKDPEFKSLRDLQGKLSAANLQIDGIRPVFDGRDNASIAVKSEWKSFRGLSSEGAGVFNDALESAAVERLGRSSFSIRSDFEDRRKELLRESLASLDSSYKKAAAIRPEKTFAAEKLRLLNLRLKLTSLDADNSYVMPEYRVAAIKEEASRIEAMLYAEERSHSAAVAEKFRKSSAETQERLNSSMEKLDAELSAALEDSLAREKKLFDRSAAKESKSSEKMSADALDARKKMLGGSSIQNQIALDSDKPYTVLEDQKKEAADEILRRISRKSVAVAERKNLGIIFNTQYPPLKGTLDITKDF